MKNRYKVIAPEGVDLTSGHEGQGSVIELTAEQAAQYEGRLELMAENVERDEQ